MNRDRAHDFVVGVLAAGIVSILTLAWFFGAVFFASWLDSKFDGGYFFGVITYAVVTLCIGGGLIAAFGKNDD